MQAPIAAEGNQSALPAAQQLPGSCAARQLLLRARNALQHLERLPGDEHQATAKRVVTSDE